MKDIVVIGATGKTGRLVCDEAVEKGYIVRGFGRSAETVFQNGRVEAFKGDVLNQQDVKNALSGQDSVIVCIGPISLKDDVTLKIGAENIVSAMQANGISRVIFISSAGVGASWKQIPLSSKILFRTMLKGVLKQHGIEEEIFSGSDLDWTAVRPAVLSNAEKTNQILASNTAKTSKISRGDVAEFLVSQIDDKSHIRGAIAITNG